MQIGTTTRSRLSMRRTSAAVPVSALIAAWP
jgi:hypothetical protein